MIEAKPRHTPPRKLQGQARGQRRMAGAVLDISGAVEIYGGTSHLWRARVSRRLVPFRRWGGRIVFLRSELEAFFAVSLPGCSVEEARENIKAREGE